MKRILFLLLTVHALERGREYEKDKVCKELTNFGKDDFTSLSMVLYSRKFPSGTFEQISHLVKEVVSLTEACCAEGADPDCYDNRTSALSAKSCDSDSPFPVHPGTAECCTQEGLERKLCMAALKHQPQEFPTYVEPSNDEICEAFRKDPKEFANQFMYEYSINYGQAPLPLLVSYTKSYLSMVGSCCTSSSPTVCFFERATQPPELPEVALPTSKDVCGKGNTKAMDRYTFELSRRTDVPEVFLSKILEPTFKSLGECCDSKDPAVCFDAKVPQLKEELSSFIDKGHELCADYSENTFTEYKKKLTERLRAKLPDAPDTELEELVEKRSDFASKCCSINSLPLL